MSTTSILSKLPTATGGRADSTTTSSLEMAAKANMFIKLHVKDGCNKGVEIPLIDLLTATETASASDSEYKVSYSTLRRLALTALFKHEKKIPEYAQKNFQTCFTCTVTGHGNILLRNDNDLTTVLEEASTNHLMDDNDNFVLHIHCTFINTFKPFGGKPTFVTKDEMNMIRESATAAADNAKKTMKTWLEKATKIFQKFVTEDDDYVVVVSNKKSKKNDVDPVEWASRFVEFLFTDRQRPVLVKKPKSAVKCVNKKLIVVQKQEQRKESHLDAAEQMLDAAVDGFTMATDILAEVVLRHEEVLQNFFMTRKNKKTTNKDKACQTSTHSSLSVPSSKDSASLSSVSPISTSSSDDEVEEIKEIVEQEQEQDFNLDRGVEIEFDPESVNNELTEDEWKIFFTSSTEEKNEEESGAVLLDIPCAQDVVSISSDEFLMESDQSLCPSQCESQNASSVSDDDSWAMLDDE